MFKYWLKSHLITTLFQFYPCYFVMNIGFIVSYCGLALQFPPHPATIVVTHFSKSGTTSWSPQSKSRCGCWPRLLAVCTSASTENHTTNLKSQNKSCYVDDLILALLTVLVWCECSQTQREKKRNSSYKVTAASIRCPETPQADNVKKPLALKREKEREKEPKIIISNVQLSDLPFFETATDRNCPIFSGRWSGGGLIRTSPNTYDEEQVCVRASIAPLSRPPYQRLAKAVSTKQQNVMRMSSVT